MDATRDGVAPAGAHEHTLGSCPECFVELQRDGEWWRARPEGARLVGLVVARDDLVTATMALANQIAQMHPHALLQTKRMVNQTVNAQGFNVAIEAAFDIHSLGHANAQAITGRPSLAGLAVMAEAGRKEG